MFEVLPSLKLTAKAPENRPIAPKGSRIVSQPPFFLRGELLVWDVFASMYSWQVMANESKEAFRIEKCWKAPGRSTGWLSEGQNIPRHEIRSEN